jgi:transposase
MTEFTLLQDEISNLKKAYKAAKKKRDADRIKAIILLGTEWTIREVAEVIYTICDNARYYRSKKVKEYLRKSKIELVFLPPYSPNLNLIERLWKYFRKIVLYNKYYGTFDEFRKACKSFFRRIKRDKEDISSLLTENFQIIGPNA